MRNIGLVYLVIALTMTELSSSRQLLELVSVSSEALVSMGEADYNWTSGNLSGNGSLSEQGNRSIVLGALEDGLEGYPYPSKYGWLHIILAAIVVTVIIASIVVGNTLVIVAIATDHNLKALQNWFIASLAVSDLLLGLLIMPFSLANELMGYWYFGEVMCQLWLSIDVLLCTASILNLCLISLDRYWSITRAISYVKTRTKQRAAIMIALVWVLSAIICFPPLAGWKRPQPHKYGLPLCVLSEEIGYVVYSTMGSFYIPLLVMVVVYFKIYLAARERARKNLRKKKVPVTTSPTNKNGDGAKGKNEALKEKDDSSDLEDEAEPLNLPEGGETTDAGMESGDIRLTATNHRNHGNQSGPDEKHKLLSEDTDNDTWQLQPNRANKALQVSDFDTDTQSDCPQDKQNGYQPVSRDSDNGKPLLHAQNDSDKNSNKISQTEEHNDGSEESKELSKESSKASTAQGSPEQSKPPSKNATKAPKTQNKKPAIAGLRGLGHTKAKDKPQKVQKVQKVENKPLDPEKQKRKIARARERRATLVLGVIMATFILCWFPFFTVYLISVIFSLHIPNMVFAVMFWGGYCNSALNPMIYTIFNMDFRKAFKRLLFGRKRYR